MTTVYGATVPAPVLDGAAADAATRPSAAPPTEAEAGRSAGVLLPADLTHPVDLARPVAVPPPVGATPPVDGTGVADTAHAPDTRNPADATLHD